MKSEKGKYAWTAKVGEKGQIVIPKEAREIFQIAPGDTILLLGDERRGIAIVNNAQMIRFAEAVLNAQTETEES